MNDTPRQLPIFKVGNKQFFKDTRLSEYRNVKNPHEKYTFDEMSLIFSLLDVGGELIGIIEREAERLSIKIVHGQSMLNNEAITHLITPDGELITISRVFEPDEEILEEILREE